MTRRAKDCGYREGVYVLGGLHENTDRDAAGGAQDGGGIGNAGGKDLFRHMIRASESKGKLHMTEDELVGCHC